MTRFTFSGYSLKTWVFKNKESLKLIVSGATGLLTAWASGLNPAYSVAVGTVIAAVSKMILDGIDYFQSS